MAKERYFMLHSIIFGAEIFLMVSMALHRFVDITRVSSEPQNTIEIFEASSKTISMQEACT